MNVPLREPLLAHSDPTVFGRLDGWLTNHRPTLNDILGSVCEAYKIDPSEIDQPKARQARRTFCFFAACWSGVPYVEIAHHINVGNTEVSHLASLVRRCRKSDPALRDDIDVMTLSIADWVARRERFDRRGA